LSAEVERTLAGGRWEAAVDEQDPHKREPAPSAVPGGTDTGRAAAATPEAVEPAPATTGGRPARRRGIAAGLIAALGVTAFSLVFVVAFVGALHNPGPRSVPIGFVGPPAGASALSQALDQAKPGGFVVTDYSTEAQARDAIVNRHIDAVFVLTPPHLVVATATGQAVTNATVQVFESAAGVALPVVNIRPLHASDPQGLSQVFFVVALLVPSLLFGNMLVKQISPRLQPLLQLAVIAVYAAIVAAAATAVADGWIGALIGAPWGLFGIGTLLAFAAAVAGAAVTRWAGRLGYAVLALLLIPIGISSSGTTLGPNMITQWYADLGKALPPGSALPAVQNTIYFNGNAITTPLLILSAWALAGAVALALAGVFHPRLARHSEPTPIADHSAMGAEDVGSEPADLHADAEVSKETERLPTDKSN
jgi:hypothetical protein